MSLISSILATSDLAYNAALVAIEDSPHVDIVKRQTGWVVVFHKSVMGNQKFDTEAEAVKRALSRIAMKSLASGEFHEVGGGQ
jgi:hypothetical protein